MIFKAVPTKDRVKVNRNALFTKLDTMTLISVLSKSKSFPKSVIDAIREVSSSYESINIISSFVENGGPEVVDEFTTILRGLGHCEIVELIDTSVIHKKAGKIIIIIKKIYISIGMYWHSCNNVLYCFL